MLTNLGRGRDGRCSTSNRVWPLQRWDWSTLPFRILC